MTDDEFFERLRADAAPLRHQPDEFTLARIRARIHERLAPRVTVAQLLAAWFRPLAATLTAVAVAAAIGLATIDVEDTSSEESVEIVVAGDTYRVGD
jgi:hypothetical protein